MTKTIPNKTAGPETGTGHHRSNHEREVIDHASAEPIPGRRNGHDQAIRKDQRGQEQPADKTRAQKNK